MNEILGKILGVLILIIAALLFGWMLEAIWTWNADPGGWTNGERFFGTVIGFGSLIAYRRWGYLL